MPTGRSAQRWLLFALLITWSVHCTHGENELLFLSFSSLKHISDLRWQVVGGNRIHFAEVLSPLRVSASLSANEEVGLDQWFPDIWTPRPGAWAPSDLAMFAFQGLLVVAVLSWPRSVPFWATRFTSTLKTAGRRWRMRSSQELPPFSLISFQL